MRNTPDKEMLVYTNERLFIVGIELWLMVANDVRHEQFHLCAAEVSYGGGQMGETTVAGLERHVT